MLNVPLFALLPWGEFVLAGGRPRWLRRLRGEEVRGEDGQGYETQE
jgi:hypothetical protein